MKTLQQTRFDGGIAEDIRTTNTNECEISTGFDLYTNPHKLLHYRDQLAETGSNVDDMEIADVGMTTIAGTNYMVAFGYDTASTLLAAAYTRTAYDFNGAWTQQAVGVAGYEYCKGTYIQYLGISFALTRNGTTYNLQKYTGAGSLTSVGTFTALASVEVPRPYIHPDDKVLYMAVGNTIAKYDGTTFSSVSTILPTGHKAMSVAHFGGFLSILTTPLLTGESGIQLWGRDTGINTLQGYVPVGSYIGQSIANIDGYLIIISRGDNLGTFSEKKIQVRAYSGGDTADVIKEIAIPSASTTNYNIASTKKDNKLYFAISGEKAIYMCCKNKSGRYIVTQDRLLSAGTATALSNVFAMNFVGDVLYVASLEDGTYKLTATDRESSVPYVNTSRYTTTINPGMSEGDRELDKRLIHVQVNFDSAYATGTTVLKYIVDGTTATVATKTNSISTNLVVENDAESDGVPFKTGKDFQFTIESGCSNIKSIRYTYEVIQLK